MARVEHGQYKVQAEDIAYTINGWIKGSNSTALDSTLDMGNDSDTGYLSWNTNIHKFIARDEVSYSLGYYNGDYEGISGAGKNWLASLSGSGLADSSSKLFNGNIGHMATNWRTGIAAQAMAYSYDQLNRLVEATAFQNLNAGTNTWSSGGTLTDYHEAYTYDLNGNILTLEREGTTTDMDDFDYNYISNTNQLEYVEDGVSSGNYAVDIDNQSAGNYAYNAIGQLVVDSSEKAEYEWNVYGKIKEVGRTGSGSESALAFAYDPQGNRAYKAVKPRSSGVLSTQLDWTEEWYVRDVRGNIMAVYGSSYDSTGQQGSQACGYAVINGSPGTWYGDHIEIEVNSVLITSTWVGYDSDDFTTACSVAAAINTYGMFTATCSRDTVYICTLNDTSGFNGHSVASGPGTAPSITVTGSTLTGGKNHTLVYHMSLDVDEHHIYGSSRLGISSHLGTITEMEFDATVTVQGNFDNVDVQSVTNNTFQNAFIAANTSITGGGTIPTKFMKEDIGLKIYEYTNHLGNVLLTTNDKRLRIDNNSDNLIDSYLADDLSKSDYYPYGMAMVGRNSNLSDYRFGYQGSEMDNEFDGSAGSHYTTYFRQLDPRLGRWMSIDPVTQPWQSPYTSMDCNPIALNDVMGDRVNPIGRLIAKLKGQKHYGTTGTVRKGHGRISKRPMPAPTQSASRSFRLGVRIVGLATSVSHSDNSTRETKRVGSFSSGIELSNWVRQKQNQGYNIDIQITKISTPYENDAGGNTTYTVSVGSNTYINQGGDGPQYPDISVNEDDEVTISVAKTSNEYGDWDNCTEYTISATVQAVKSSAHRQYYLMVPKQSGNHKEKDPDRLDPVKRNQRYYKPLLGRFGISNWWKMNFDFYDPNNPSEPIKWNKENPIFPGTK